ncbi:MAG: Spy/CpxP family protein refolding chaperone [Pyrinomonadaceae bacterium]
MRKLALLIIAIAFCSVGILAQETPREAPQDTRPNLMQQLGLTPDQLRQIRQLNQQRKPQIEEAQGRVKQANQALDAAIYSDNVDEAEVKARLSDLQQAEAEVARIRFTNELAIRRILTPEQLGRFRELRQQFAAAAREEVQKRRQERLGENKKPPAGSENADQNLRQMIRQQNQQNRKLKTTAPAQTPPKPKN